MVFFQDFLAIWILSGLYLVKSGLYVRINSSTSGTERSHKAEKICNIFCHTKRADHFFCSSALCMSLLGKSQLDITFPSEMFHGSVSISIFHWWFGRSSEASESMYNYPKICLSDRKSSAILFSIISNVVFWSIGILLGSRRKLTSSTITREKRSGFRNSKMLPYCIARPLTWTCNCQSKAMPVAGKTGEISSFVEVTLEEVLLLEVWWNLPATAV